MRAITQLHADPFPLCVHLQSFPQIWVVIYWRDSTELVHSMLMIHLQTNTGQKILLNISGIPFVLLLCFYHWVIGRQHLRGNTCQKHIDTWPQDVWAPAISRLREPFVRQFGNSRESNLPVINTATHSATHNLKHWHFHFISNVYPVKTCCAHMPFFSSVLLHIHTHRGAARYILVSGKLHCLLVGWGLVPCSGVSSVMCWGQIRPCSVFAP